MSYKLIRQRSNDGSWGRWMTVKTTRKGFKFHVGTNGDEKCELPWVRKHAEIADNFWEVSGTFSNKVDCLVAKRREEDDFLSVTGRIVYTNHEYNKMKVRRKS